ncbi:alcohol dehydrogenase, class IV [Halogeometricum borinquense DSM 11551]|uniref:Alcohol dehydrogenase, class IV n=1 Tax=Halogeometricum borinquense (strain ATCC 700274 / DSM 11551 / JCM 10706 / KCTC 4070 / PR3) TaxID=469382 RepID=E4NW11_HALBP|nr:iron-containing alcohol dehydrogenase family protein [Halogeometricum borinquense]ADQ69231.1 alcohol dehydrogenase, class IV [Halogeometricum borinquense DSM 11551]ELY31530.1 alcohol dehydrogenase, class IV [Halogeometricum borinquense DSM 11551]
MSQSDRFRFEYNPGVLQYGAGCVDSLSAELERLGSERALVVSGSTVGTTPAVIEPVTDGLGTKLAGVFAETTPEKRLQTAYDGLEAMEEADADVLVSLGGGSSLDVAKVISVLAADDRDPQAVGAEFGETGTISVPSGSVTPIVVVPTTLAGADLSTVAGVTASPESGLVERPVSGGISDPRLMPRATFYDPVLFATTPKQILAASAMNGFDKGIETIYARNATPITDATAVRGLKLLEGGLRQLNEQSVSEKALEPVAQGLLLVQYGISRPGETTLSIIHAFGHALTRSSAVQQGAMHGIIAPHVLSYLFENVAGRRELLAEALCSDVSASAEDIVASVEWVRDALSLPSRLRDVDGPDPAAFPDVAESVLADPFMANAPSGLDPTSEEIADVLRDAY